MKVSYVLKTTGRISRRENFLFHSVILAVFPVIYLHITIEIEQIHFTIALQFPKKTF